ncbi:MAG: type I methionyl aminopeptidase [Spirochaetes bacterium]|nr:type I methionyl aminopeptidase [Spirochaetota bacterium]
MYTYSIDEISIIEEACLITARVLDDIERIIKVGISTYELDAFAQEKIAEYNAKPAFLGYRGFPGAICASKNEVVVHGIPDKNIKLANGDIIGIDMGVHYKGFYGDSARTFSIGAIDKETQKLIEVTRESLYKGIDNSKVGNRISDISNAVEQHVTKYGFSPVREFVGHGIGANLHEEPSIPNFGEKGKGPRIKNGMVFAIEPMINIGTYDVDVLSDGWTVVTKDKMNSAHFEHTVAILDGSAKILTRGKTFN